MAKAPNIFFNLESESLKSVHKRVKLEDTLVEEEGKKSSRQVAWWNAEGFKPLYKLLRKGRIDEKILESMDGIENIDAFFGFRGHQYGEWLSNEDRYNYLYALTICGIDLNSVMQFKDNNIGFGQLGVALGARGHSRAQAHFEPTTNIINMTRYKAASSFKPPFYRKPPSKEMRFVYTGGIGSFAHEYGHFLDYIFGGGVEPYSQSVSLSHGRDSYNIAKGRKKYSGKYPMRILMEDVLELICMDGNG